jgi:hypothetical protein
MYLSDLESDGHSEFYCQTVKIVLYQVDPAIPPLLLSSKTEIEGVEK